MGMAIDVKRASPFYRVPESAEDDRDEHEDGKVEAALPIGAGVDATDFDNGQAFASCGDGTLTVWARRAASGVWSRR